MSVLVSFAFYPLVGNLFPDLNYPKTLKNNHKLTSNSFISKLYYIFYCINLYICLVQSLSLFSTLSKLFFLRACGDFRNCPRSHSLASSQGTPWTLRQRRPICIRVSNTLFIKLLLVALFACPTFKTKAQSIYTDLNISSNSANILSGASLKDIAPQKDDNPRTYTAFDQTPDSVINFNARIWKRYASHKAPNPFLFCDKNIYVHGENILFSAFLLNAGADTSENHTLYVVLTNLATKTVATWDRFVMSGGLSSGYLYVDDTLPAGEYLLQAYTNAKLEGAEQKVFRQQISIRSAEKDPFYLTVTPSQDKVSRGDSIRLVCRVTTDISGLASGGDFSYQLASDGYLLDSGFKKIDAFGEISISLPAKDSLARHLVLRARVDRKGKTKSFWVPVVTKPNQLTIDYYPEGGNLVDGHFSRIAIDIQNGKGMGIATTGDLLENGQVIANFETNEYGLGTIDCTVHHGRKYSVHLYDSNTGSIRTGDFPSILTDGFTLNIPNGVIRDSLIVQITPPLIGSKCILMIYNDQTILYESKFSLDKKAAQISIPVKDWLKGIATVTLFSEKGIQVAERTIFLPGEHLNIQIHTDSAAYHDQSKVKIHVKITDDKGLGTKAIFSFSSILTGRLDLSRARDIVQYSSIDQYLSDSYESISPIENIDDDAAFELTLLTRFYARCRWEDLCQKATKAQSQKKEIDYGQVFLTRGEVHITGDDNNLTAKKDLVQVKEPIPMLMMSNDFVNKFNTDSDGHFTIPHNTITSKGGDKIILSVITKKSQEDYSIILQNTYDSVNNALASTWWYSQHVTKDNTTFEESEKLKPFNSLKAIKGIVIKGKSSQDDLTPSSDAPCYDWVCQFGALNCPAHHFGTKPIIGKNYQYIPPAKHPGNIIIIKYRGCILHNPYPFINEINAIHIAEDSYSTDTTNTNSLKPSMLSTQYWSPIVLTDENGDATITLTSNDRKGPYYNIIQGISSEGPFRSSCTIVRK